jgi:hypothetical protein
MSSDQGWRTNDARNKSFSFFLFSTGISLKIFLYVKSTYCDSRFQMKSFRPKVVKRSVHDFVFPENSVKSPRNLRLELRVRHCQPDPLSSQITLPSTLLSSRFKCLSVTLSDRKEIFQNHQTVSLSPLLLLNVHSHALIKWGSRKIILSKAAFHKRVQLIDHVQKSEGQESIIYVDFKKQNKEKN